MKTMMTLSLLLSLGMGPLTAEPVSLEKALGSPAGTRSLLVPTSFTLSKLPGTLDEFLAFRDAQGKDVRGGAVATAVALMLCGKDRTLGLTCLTATLDAGLLSTSESKDAYKGFTPSSQTLYLLKQVEKMPWIGNLVVDGVKVEGSYRLPEAGPYTFTFHQLTVDKGDEVRIYFNTAGGNIPRPVALKRNDKGIWKASNISSLVVGPSKMPSKVAADPL